MKKRIKYIKKNFLKISRYGYDQYKVGQFIYNSNGQIIWVFSHNFSYAQQSLTHDVNLD